MLIGAFWAGGVVKPPAARSILTIGEYGVGGGLTFPLPSFFSFKFSSTALALELLSVLRLEILALSLRPFRLFDHVRQ